MSFIFGLELEIHVLQSIILDTCLCLHLVKLQHTEFGCEPRLFVLELHDLVYQGACFILSRLSLFCARFQVLRELFIL
jgi:hypothetical protein